MFKKAALLLVWDGTERVEDEQRSGVILPGWEEVGVGSGPLTACPQSQASGAATEEIVQGVVGLLADLGADAGGEAKHGPDSSCRVDGKSWR